MNPKANELLVPFYFGSVGEVERRLIERELLSDPETLLEYLDLKRELEAAASVPQKPSTALWARLQPRLARKRTWVSISVGAALAAGMALFFVLRPATIVDAPAEPAPPMSRILFDSGSEHPASSGVL